MLRGVKIIAEAWDAAGAYQVGSFPSERWSEWNGKYRDDIRDFWLRRPRPARAPSPRACAAAPTSTTGPASRPHKSVNYIASHDGFTLADIVSYAEKHNLANCEDNRDGDNHNHSDNCGKEGPTDRSRPSCAKRQRRQKNLLATLFLVAGRAHAAGRRRIRPHAARQQQRLLPGQRDLVGGLEPAQEEPRALRVHAAS